MLFRPIKNKYLYLPNTFIKNRVANTDVMIVFPELNTYKIKLNTGASVSESEHGARETHYSYIHPFCTGNSRYVEFDGVCISHLRFHIDRKLKGSFRIENDRVILFFVLKGMVSSENEVMGTRLWQTGSHNIISIHQTEGVVTCEKGDTEVFYMSLPVAMFKSYFPRNEAAFNTFHRKMSADRFSVLRKQDGRINHLIYRLIQEICHCQRKDSLKKMYLQAKVIELLSIQLEELCTLCSTGCDLKEGDAEKMYFVREFILNHISGYHSLPDLAKMAGTNEYTLKREFKSLFGFTVFEFWHHLKMEKAQQLLEENEKSIKQISEEVGYKNPQHFSTAFKKKFGMTPSLFQKSRVVDS